MIRIKTVLNKYMPVKYSKCSPVRVLHGKLARPTRLDTLNSIKDNLQGLYSDAEIRQAKRALIKENS